MITKLRTAAETAYNTGQDVQVNPGLILALLDRLEAAEKDAARYRWMREQDGFTLDRLMEYCETVLDVDAAVDAQLESMK